MFWRTCIDTKNRCPEGRFRCPEGRSTSAPSARSRSATSPMRHQAHPAGLDWASSSLNPQGRSAKPATTGAPLHWREVQDTGDEQRRGWRRPTLKVPHWPVQRLHWLQKALSKVYVFFLLHVNLDSLRKYVELIYKGNRAQGRSCEGLRSCLTRTDTEGRLIMLKSGKTKDNYLLRTACMSSKSYQKRIFSISSKGSA